MRSTWAPKGKTPVLQHRFSWKRLSMSAVVGYSADGSEAWLVFQMRPGSYNEETLIEFLGELHDHLDGDKVTVLWDGLPSHRSRAMKAFIVSQRSWLVVEPLPGYAHDLNPVEMIWGNLKASELANLCPDTIEEAALYADAGLERIGGDAQLCLAFLRHTDRSISASALTQSRPPHRRLPVQQLPREEPQRLKLCALLKCGHHELGCPPSLHVAGYVGLSIVNQSLF